MVGRIRFGSRELFDVLTDMSTRLDDEVEAYLIGGLAMMHHGLKVTTKDVDVVFKDEVDEQTFEDALRACGFYGVTNVPREYRELGAMIIMEVPGGMRFDIFVETVCRKLRLTEGMRGRAEALGLDGRLRLMVCSPEDIFLFKSVTDRDDDLADMAFAQERFRAVPKVGHPGVVDHKFSVKVDSRALPHLDDPKVVPLPKGLIRKNERVLPS